MIIDSHSHYNLAPFYPNWQKHWQAAQEKGVTHSVVVGTDLETSRRAIEIAVQEKNLFAAVGIHPTEWNKSAENVLAAVAGIDVLASHPKVVAIGETGLDYFHFDEKVNREQAIFQQQQAFRMHIQLAQKHGKVLIIHVRDKEEQAYWDTLQCLEAENYTGKFILHCVSGPLAYIDQAVQLGAFFGVAGNVTYKSAESLREIVRRVPQLQLQTETDCPFLPPVPYRGKTCEPWMIAETAAFLENELAVSIQAVADASVELFQLPL